MSKKRVQLTTPKGRTLGGVNVQFPDAMIQEVRIDLERGVSAVRFAYGTWTGNDPDHPFLIGAREAVSLPAAETQQLLAALDGPGDVHDRVHAFLATKRPDLAGTVKNGEPS